MNFQREIFEVTNLYKSYTKNTMVINNVNLKIEKGKYYTIMGKSGCGKTTLLKLLGGMEKPSAGRIYFNGKQIPEMKNDELADFKRCHVGFVYQDYRLLNHLTVEENMMLPLILDEKDVSRSLKRAKEMGEEMKISHLMKRHPVDLSGGEKQRVAIGRALMNNPDIILADEPTGNLDSKSSEIIVNIFREMHEVMKKTIILVSHDAKMASYSEEVIFLKDGRITETLKRSMNEDFYNAILMETINL